MLKHRKHFLREAKYLDFFKFIYFKSPQCDVELNVSYFFFTALDQTVVLKVRSAHSDLSEWKTAEHRRVSAPLVNQRLVGVCSSARPFFI